MGHAGTFFDPESVLGSLPCIDEDTAALLRAACHRDSDIVFAVSTGRRFGRGCWTAPAPYLEPAALSAELVCDACTLTISISEGLLADSERSVDFEAFPDLLRRAYAIEVLYPLIDAFSAKIGKKVEVAAIARAFAPLPAPCLALEVRDGDGHLSGTCLLHGELDGPPWRTLAMPGASRAGDGWPIHPALASLALTLPAEVGMARVDAADLCTLALDDVLLMHPSIHRQDGLAACIRLPTAPPVTVHVRHAAGGFEIVTMGGDMKQMEVSQNDDGRPAARIDPVRIPVELTFSIGQVTTTLAEIGGLRPGYVFAAIGCEEASGVTVLANGKPFAGGELVNVGGRIGVRIQTLHDIREASSDG